MTGEDGREALAVALQIVADIERSLPSLAGARRRPARRVREILFVAGEASGDLHAAGVARGARARRRAVSALTGIGGDAMRDAGVELLEHAEQLAVMGFVEVLKHVPASLRARCSELERAHPRAGASRSWC